MLETGYKQGRGGGEVPCTCAPCMDLFRPERAAPHILPCFIMSPSHPFPHVQSVTPPSSVRATPHLLSTSLHFSVPILATAPRLPPPSPPQLEASTAGDGGGLVGGEGVEGSPDPIPPQLRRAVSVYEAGKALLAYITPDYEEIARVSGGGRGEDRRERGCVNSCLLYKW